MQQENQFNLQCSFYNIIQCIRYTWGGGEIYYRRYIALFLCLPHVFGFVLEYGSVRSFMNMDDFDDFDRPTNHVREERKIQKKTNHYRTTSHDVKCKSF